MRTSSRASSTVIKAGVVLAFISAISGGVIVAVRTPEDPVLAVAIYATIIASVGAVILLVIGSVMRDNENRSRR